MLQQQVILQEKVPEKDFDFRVIKPGRVCCPPITVLLFMISAVLILIYKALLYKRDL